MIHDGKGDHWVEDLNPPPPNPMFPFEDLDFVAAHPRFIANLLEQLSVEEEYDVEESDVEKSDVEEADVEESDVEEADVEEADVEESDVEEADVEEADVEDSDNEDFYTDDSESSVYSEIEDHYMFLDEDIQDVGVPPISIDISKMTAAPEQKKESLPACKKRAREEDAVPELRYSRLCRWSLNSDAGA